MTLKSTLVLAFALSCAAHSFAQEQLGAGAPLPALTLNDQHDKPHPLPADTRRVLFVADNGGTALLTQLVESRGPGWLTENKQVFVADIHRMPGLIARLIAIPRLQEKPYQILLGRDAAELQMFPRQKDCVTVVGVKEGNVAGLRFACNPEELQMAVGS